ncbi:endonuclease/exonuclease/phosphatase family protein [Gracilinema caldarium]|uniref:Endonuclease/exonuclease/phosphatase n=1 Tax=Gracilinema caldarium (strain ATCC 51460 / DSM 7334 / H1) TaxID=744872 RepID=F8EWZ4_GRAC1|nr:endonuclease/exonuclease/phosphatase family protein [Gracilinema caldarium]AEJ18521.1 Endonuclease/exonuclease/phosphatase [Gracilinema caldarium DSM 7334]
MVRSFCFRLMYIQRRLRPLLWILLLPSFFFSCAGCENPFSGKKLPTHFSLATWNLQAFFDGQEIGTEYADYRLKASWNEVSYKKRLQNLGNVLSKWPEPQTKGAEHGPDIFALIEVENAAVVEDLRSGPFAQFKYTYSAFAANPGASLGLGLLSRFPIIATKTHSMQTASYSTPRPMLEAEIELSKESQERLHLFVCHWKSKLGDPEDTEALRRASAQLVNRRIVELASEYTNVQPLILVVGDLNENADEYARQGSRFITALMPTGASAVAEVSSEANHETNTNRFNSIATRPCSFIILTGSPSMVSIPDSGPVTLYSPWYTVVWNGSYAYHGTWESIDHILLSPGFFNGIGWEYTAFSVIDYTPFSNEAGYPNSFNPRTGSGVSDHLPIMVDFHRI